MQTIRGLGLGLTDPEPIVSIRALAARVGLSPTFSVLDMIARLKAPISFHDVITTPSGGFSPASRRSTLTSPSGSLRYMYAGTCVAAKA